MMTEANESAINWAMVAYAAECARAGMLVLDIRDNVVSKFGLTREQAMKELTRTQSMWLAP